MPGGDTFEQRYEVRGRLWLDGPNSGQLAFDRRLVREVVVNIPYRPVDNDRLIQTARLRARLRHANLIPVYDIGMTGDGRPFYTEPFINVRDLEQLLRDPEPGASSIPFVRLLHVFLDACKAIAFLHANELLHLLLQPGDILVTERLDEVFVVNGHAAFPPGTPALELADVEKTGTITVSAYMAPEQADPTCLGRPGIAADIYGLGGILYTILYGHPPNGDGSRPFFEILHELMTRKGPIERRVFHPRAARSRKLAMRLKRVCSRALKFDPSKRQSSVESFVEEIERIVWMHAD